MRTVKYFEKAVIQLVRIFLFREKSITIGKDNLIS